MDPSNVRYGIDTLAGASRIDPVLRPAAAPAGRGAIPELGGCAIGGPSHRLHLETLQDSARSSLNSPTACTSSADRPAARSLAALPVPLGATEQTLLTRRVLATGGIDLKGAVVDPSTSSTSCRRWAPSSRWAQTARSAGRCEKLNPGYTVAQLCRIASRLPRGRGSPGYAAIYVRGAASRS